MPRNANFYISRQRVALRLASRKQQPSVPQAPKAPKPVKPSKSK